VKKGLKTTIGGGQLRYISFKYSCLLYCFSIQKHWN